jgi:uroporphyrinogen-III synthase
VSRAKDLETKLERAEQQLRLLQRISRFIVRETPPGEALDHIVTDVVEFMECDSCLIYVLDKSEVVLCASNTSQHDAIGKVRLKLSEGLTGWVARERRLLAISKEAFNDPRFKHFHDLPEDAYEAFLSAPLIARNKVVGVINIQHRAPHSHSGEELELLTAVGEMVGTLLLLAAKIRPDMDVPGVLEQVLATASSRQL